MDGLTSTGAIVSSPQMGELLEEKRGSTWKKIAIVALCILIGVGVGALTAVTGGLDIALCLAVGGAVGLIAGIVYLIFSRCFPRSSKAPLVGNKKDESVVKNEAVSLAAQPPQSPQPVSHSAQPLVLAQEPASKAVKGLIQQQFIEDQEKNLEVISTTLADHFEQKKGMIILSEAELDQILDVVDQTKVGHYQLSQYQIIYKEFVKVFGEQKTREVFKVPGLLGKSLPSHLSPKLIEHFLEKAKNYFHNQKVLQQIRELEKLEFKDEVNLDEVLKEYLTGQRKLSKKTEKYILECVREKHAQKSFDQLLEKVKGQAQKDLYLDDDFIEKRFNIATVLTPLTDKEKQMRREQLQKVINQAFVSRELKQKGKLATGKTEEMRLLSYLGYKVGADSKYQDKEFIYGMIQEIIQNQLQNELATGPLVLVKQTIKTCSQNARLKAAGLVTALQLNKFRGIEDQFSALKQELTELHQPIKLPLPQGFPLSLDSLTVQSIKKDFERVKALFTNQILSKFFRNGKIKTSFENPNVSVDAFCANIDENQKLHLRRNELTEKCRKALEDPLAEPLLSCINLHHKWGRYLKAELIQGFNDAGEALGNGVCWGTCQRVRFIGQKQPEMTADALAREIKLTGQDRYFQGAYQLAAKGSPRIPAAIAKEGYELNKLCDVNYDEDEPILAKLFESYGSKLAQSAGWIDFGLAMVNGETYDGHALLVRWDMERNRYWVVDSNVGFLCFERADSTNEEIQQRCLEFLKDLIKAYYPLTIQIQANQLIKSG